MKNDKKNQPSPVLAPEIIRDSIIRIAGDSQDEIESIVTLSGVGCSWRFPYFVKTHSVHCIHGCLLPFAAGLRLIPVGLLSEEL
jgi:hypothetical protein